MAAPFLDDPIPAAYLFTNTPGRRTRREATVHYLLTKAETNPGLTRMTKACIRSLTRWPGTGLSIDELYYGKARK